MGRIWLMLLYGSARLLAFRSQMQCHYWQAEDAILQQQMSENPQRVAASAIISHVESVKYSASAVAVRILVGSCMFFSTTIVYKLKSDALASGARSDLSSATETQSLLGLFMFSPAIYTALGSFFLWWIAAVALFVAITAPVALK